MAIMPCAATHARATCATEQSLRCARLLKPSLIRVRTVIGYGAPRAGTKAVHGEALGPDGVKSTKKFFGFDPDQSFVVPEAALNNWRQAVDKGKHEQADRILRLHQNQSSNSRNDYSI